MISEGSSSLDKKYQRRTLPSLRFCSFFIQQSGRYGCAVYIATVALTLMLATFTLLVRQDDRVLSANQRQLRNGVELNLSVKKEEPKGMKLVWLMSFPNSGTSFTSRVIRDLTKTDSASNYADGTPTGKEGVQLPVFDSMPDGPFWINKPEQGLQYSEPREYVLTKVRNGNDDMKAKQYILSIEKMNDKHSHNLVFHNFFFRFPIRRIVDYDVRYVHRKSTPNLHTVFEATVSKQSG
jgi:hypothetical protein